MRQALLWTVLFLGGGTAINSLVEAGAASAGQQAARRSSDPKVDSTSSPPTLKVDFQDAQPLSMSYAGGSRYRVSFFVKNDDEVDGTLSFHAVLQDNDKKLLRSSPTAVCEKVDSSCDKVLAGKFDNVTIELNSQANQQTYALPLVGYLELTAEAEGRKASHQYRLLKLPPALPSPMATGLFQWTLAASTCVVVISIVVLGFRGDLGRRMGSASWTFGDSWGTNIAVGGALLTTLLGFSALPEQTHYLNKVAYLCLSLIFAALITLAPSIYALIRTPVMVEGSDVPQFQGYVLTFAVASGVTLWGALGQLAAVGLLFAELRESREISSAVVSSLVALLGSIAILLIIYALRTIVQIPAKHGRVITATSARAGDDVTQLPSWPIL